MASRPLPLTRRIVAQPTSPLQVTNLGVFVTAALVAAGLVWLIMVDVKIGLAVLVGLCFLPLALRRPPIAACIWVAMLFFSRVSGFQSVPDHLALLLFACWIGLVVDRQPLSRQGIVDARVLIWAAVAFLVWELLTLSWAPATNGTTQPIKDLIYAFLGMLLVLATITERQHVRWLAIAFVAGATLTVLYGAAKGGLSASAASAVTDTDGRLQAGEGDPNFLAAVLVPAIMLALGLMVRRSLWQRAALIVSVLVMAVGLAATQSRGGLIAAGVAALGALIIWQGRRLAILACLVLAAGATAGYFAASPAAWHRISGGGNTGSGRTDIWTIAWRIIHDHPIFGVGLAQFPQVSPTYVRRPGALTYVAVIIDQKILVHNIYLQLWAETGIIGLVLFFVLAFVSLGGAWRACALLESQRDSEMLALARASLLSLVAVLAASFFLSDDSNRQTWVLLALGPAVAGIASRRRQATTAELEDSWWRRRPIVSPAMHEPG